jgi:hypothetical protein
MLVGVALLIKLGAAPFFQMHFFQWFQGYHEHQQNLIKILKLK